MLPNSKLLAGQYYVSSLSWVETDTAGCGRQVLAAGPTHARPYSLLVARARRVSLAHVTGARGRRQFYLSRAMVEMKLDTVAVSVLGLRLSLQLPRLALTPPSQPAEYKLKVEHQTTAYLDWRYGQLDKEERAAVQQLARAEQLHQQRLKVKEDAKAALKRGKEKGEKKRRAELSQDARVVAQLLSVEQLSNIETWLSQQPDTFPAESTQQAAVVVDTVDGFVEDVAFKVYRDIKMFGKESLV